MSPLFAQQVVSGASDTLVRFFKFVFFYENSGDNRVLGVSWHIPAQCRTRTGPIGDHSNDNNRCPTPSVVCVTGDSSPDIFRKLCERGELLFNSACVKCVRAVNRDEKKKVRLSESKYCATFHS